MKTDTVVRFKRADAAPSGVMTQDSGGTALGENTLTRQLHESQARETLFREALERIFQGACYLSAGRDNPVRPDPFLWIQATGASALSTLMAAEQIGQNDPEGAP